MNGYGPLSPLSDIPFDGDPAAFSEKLEKAYGSMRPDKALIDQPYTKVALEDIGSIEKSGKYLTEVDGTEFRFFLNVGDTETLHVFLNPAERNDRLLRWSWNGTGLNMAIADPMVTEFDIALGWFLGTKESDYREKTSRLITAVAGKYGVPNERITVYGSSGGGTASLFVSSMVPGSTSVSVNPQIELGVRSGSLKKLEEKIGCKMDSPEMSDRCDMAKAISGSRSRHLIVVNALSGEDGPPLHRLSEKLGIVPKYGLASKDNLHIWLYRAAPSINVDGMWDPHRSSDYRELFPTIDHVADNLDDPDIGKFVLYINELWAERSQQVHNYLCMKTIIDSKTDPLAMYRLSIMYKNGDNVPESMERSMECLMECSGKLDIAKKKLFYEYPRKHPQLWEKIERYVLEHPDDGSEFYLGRCYSAMTWIDGMSDKAAEFMLKSLREGSPDHRIETFDYLWNDKGHRYDDRLMDIVKGFTDLPGLGLRFGRMNLRGRGCGKDLVKAGQLITEAYREGVKGSELTLFDLYLETRDHDEEMEGLLKNGMKTDDPEAIGRMGILHFHGIGRPKSYWKAKTCFDRAMSIKRLPWIFSYQKAIRESKKKKST